MCAPENCHGMRATRLKYRRIPVAAFYLVSLKRELRTTPANFTDLLYS